MRNGEANRCWFLLSAACCLFCHKRSSVNFHFFPVFRVWKSDCDKLCLVRRQPLQRLITVAQSRWRLTSYIKCKCLLCPRRLLSVEARFKVKSSLDCTNAFESDHWWLCWMLSLWFYNLNTIKLREIIKFSLSSLRKVMIKTNTSFVIADIHTSHMKFLSNSLEVLLQRDVLLQQTIEPNKRVMCFMIGKTNFSRFFHWLNSRP